MKKDKTQRILASMIMGLNCVNSFAPMATVLVNDHVDSIKPAKEIKEPAETYTAACYQALDVIDNTVFSAAEAASPFVEEVGPGYTSSSDSHKTVAPNSGQETGGSVQTIYNGGSTYGNTVAVGGTVIIKDGAVAQSQTNSGGTVFNSGKTSCSNQNNVITNNGVENVQGGTSFRVLINSGGVMNVSDNSFVSAVWVGSAKAGGQLNISGGSVRTVYVFGNGSATIEGGSTYDVSVYDDGELTMTNGSANTLIAKGGGSIYVQGGYVSRGWTSSGGYLELQGAGATGDVIWANSGSVYIHDNCKFTNLGVIYGGKATVEDYASVTSASVYTNATLEVNNGGYVLSTTVGQSSWNGKEWVIQGDNALQVINGGTAVKTSVNGGTQTLQNGTATSNNINYSGVQNVSGGTATSNYIRNGGTQKVTGGSAVYNSMGSGVVQTIDGSGFVQHNFISSGAVQSAIGGSTEFTTVSAGGTQVVNGGTVTSNNISNLQIILSGKANNNIISNGATQNVSGGVVDYTSVQAGAVQNVSGGSVTHNHISAGGVQNLIAGSTHYNYVNGMQNISGGKHEWNVIEKGGVQNLIAGSTSITKIENGGIQNISGGIASDNYISGGAVQNLSGGTALNNTVVLGGVQNISGGTAIENEDQIVNGTINISAGGLEIINKKQEIGANATVSVAQGGTQLVGVNGEVSPGAGSLLIGGTQIISGGTADTPTLESGAKQIIYAGSASNVEVVLGATQIVSGGSSLHTTIATGGVQQAHNGTLMDNTVDGGLVEIYSPSVIVNNLTMHDGTIRLGADSGNYNFAGVFELNGGLVDMVSNPNGLNPNPRTYETLTIENLQGDNGTFKLDIDLDSAVYGSETTYGDKIVITNGVPGTHAIQVADKSLYTGTEITGDRKLLLVTDLSNTQNLTYVGKDLNNGGVWHTLPPILFKEENKWYLGYIEKEPSNDTTTYLSDRQVAVYNQWTRMNNDSLRKRLGDLRYNDAQKGVWARFYSGKLSGTGYNQNYQTYQVGIDKASGNSTYGLAIEKQETSQNYTYGNGEGSTFAGNIYFTHYTDTGSYFDTIFKYGKINSEYDTLGDFPDHADYDTRAYSLSLEYGKTNRFASGYFIEPKIQLTYGNIGTETYTTTRGTRIEESAIKSLIGKLGFTFGRKLSDSSDYYLKLGWFKEFKGERDVHLAALNGENMYKSYDYGDTWLELGIGGNIKLSKKTHLYGDIEKSFGADIQKKWQVNAGIRWEF